LPSAANVLSYTKVENEYKCCFEWNSVEPNISLLTTTGSCAKYAQWNFGQENERLILEFMSLCGGNNQRHLYV